MTNGRKKKIINILIWLNIAVIFILRISSYFLLKNDHLSSAIIADAIALILFALLFILFAWRANVKKKMKNSKADE